MKKKLIYLLFPLLIFCSINNEDKPKSNPINNVVDWSESDRDLVNLINKYRLELNLSEFEPNMDLHNLCISRLEKMKLNGNISHNGIGEIFKEVHNKGYSNASELLAYGYSSNISVLNAWKNSEQHNKKIIVKGDFYVGVHVLEYDKKKYYILLTAEK